MPDYSFDEPDPYVPAFIEHGLVNLRIEPEKVVSRSREPDQATLVYQDESKDAYPVRSIIPGYEGMPIVDRERTASGPRWIFRLQLEGIEDPRRIFIETQYEENEPEEGWDEIQRTVFTTQPDHAWFVKGAQLYDAATGLVLPGYEYMWIMERRKRVHRAFGYWEVDLLLKGLIADKPYKRRYSSTPQVVSPGMFSGETVETFDSWVGWPPVAGPGASLIGTDMTIEWDVPQVAVTDSFVTSTPPPTTKFPAFWTPNDPPPVVYFPVFGTNMTWHVPFGWKILNMQAEQLAGQQMFMMSLTFGAQIAQTPN